jgi:sugar transferase EpsL
MSPQTLDRASRVRDVLAAIFILIVTAPLLVVALIAVRLRMGSPVLFRHRRLGRGGEQFQMLKIRTMQPPRAGCENSSFDNDRLTPLGRFLRLTSIDELPSFINLLRGDITLVGPRPLPVHYWSRFVDEEYRRFEVRPGITGHAQVQGRNTIAWNDRLALDVDYVEARSFTGDLAIMLKTIPVVLTAQGVNERAGQTMEELPPDRRVRDRRVSTDPRFGDLGLTDRRTINRGIRTADSAS